jgi:hypothetical protein
MSTPRKNPSVPMSLTTNSDWRHEMIAHNREVEDTARIISSM